MTTYDDTQVMATLATLAYVDGIAGDDFHPMKDEAAFMFGQLQAALAAGHLATQGKWQLRWLGLSEDQGNLAYIAENVTENKLAVVVRGTVFALSGPGAINVLQDLAVGSLKDFQLGGQTATVGGEKVQISQGADLALMGVSNATFVVGGHGLEDTTLADALSKLIGSGSPTVYVAGHSLGGCIATMLALQLKDAWSNLAFQVYTFAATTAGLAPFAQLFDETFDGKSSKDNAWRITNRWDVVPHLWSTLESDVYDDDWYPDPGPNRDWHVYGALQILIALYGDHKYVQPTTKATVLNDVDYPSAAKDTNALNGPDDVMDEHWSNQLYFQHSMIKSYLPLLHAPANVSTGALTAGPATVRIAEPGFVHALDASSSPPPEESAHAT